MLFYLVKAQFLKIQLFNSFPIATEDGQRPHCGYDI